MQFNGLEILASPFVLNAILGGALFAICAGFLGYFIIARKMVFATHALADIGLPGATAAVLLGVNPLIGLVLFCVGGGVFIAQTSKKSNQREMTTGIILAFALALGMWLATWSNKAQKNLQALLFGSITSINTSDVLTFAVFGIVIVLGMSLIYKQLLFATINPEVAKVNGVKVKLLNLVFVLLLALTTVMSVRVLGALLPFALMVTPASIMINFSANPKVIIAGSMLIGVVGVLVSVVVSALFNLPTSFVIVLIMFVLWCVSKLLT
ncbi:MAG: metal ABC transporter permease [Candidatus Ancillula sp.]|jgi:zinc/manganese transport system permease protein|nr:metal ABC transporter permease [Candidatus Ancillula sp.]